jgi:2-dehydro-3-deoxyphosphogalactonate aldolase
VSAIRAVLPPDTTISIFGSILNISFKDHAAVGLRTFGLGSGLYKPGDSLATVTAKAQTAIFAYDAAFS